MHQSKSKSAFLAVRVTAETRAEFHSKASKYGQPSDVLREIIDAFVTDRIVITKPPVTHKHMFHLEEVLHKHLLFSLFFYFSFYPPIIGYKLKFCRIFFIDIIKSVVKMLLYYLM